MTTTTSASHYVRLFNELRRERHWSTNIELLRVAALGMVGTDLEDPSGQLEDAARELKQSAGWTSWLKHSIRYPVAALVLSRAKSPAGVHLEAERVRKFFRKRNLPSGNNHELLAAFILALAAEDDGLHDSIVKRLSAIMLRWKDDHPFITGARDYPMAAIHALAGEDVEDLAQRIERIYQELARAGFGKGNALQMASQMLALAPWNSEAAVGRFVALTWAFKKVGFRTHRRRYDELALLSLASGTPIEIAEKVRTLFDELRTQKPRPWTEIAFSIATGLTLCDSTREAFDSGIATPVAMNTVQCAVLAQQAAVVACINSSVMISNNCG